MKSIITSLIILCACMPVHAHESRNDIVTVNGQGSVAKVPDILKFTIAVEERGADSKKLSESVNRKSKQIIDVLHDHDVAKKDIQSMAVSLYPWYEREPERQTNVQKGFVYSRNINVKLRDFAHYPNILSDLFALNVSRIDGLRYEVEDQQSAYLAALKEAMLDAKRRADQLASGMNIKIGEISTIEESSAYSPTPQHSTRSMAALSDSSQYLPGQNEINASVVVSFHIEK